MHKIIVLDIENTQIIELLHKIRDVEYDIAHQSEGKGSEES
jgi:hypothetical protein